VDVTGSPALKVVDVTGVCDYEVTTSQSATAGNTADEDDELTVEVIRNGDETCEYAW
jgi:hypothetical protein